MGDNEMAKLSIEWVHRVKNAHLLPIQNKLYNISILGSTKSLKMSVSQ